MPGQVGYMPEAVRPTGGGGVGDLLGTASGLLGGGIPGLSTSSSAASGPAVSGAPVDVNWSSPFVFAAKGSNISGNEGPSWPWIAALAVGGLIAWRMLR